jgi:hypothetical protein
MSTILTKAQLLQGKDYREQVEIPSLGGVVEIRPLTQAEYAQVEILRTKGIKVTGKTGSREPQVQVQVDVAETMAREIESDCYAVSVALITGAPWTTEEVGKISPAGVVKEIVKEIYRISGVTPEGAEIVNRFRQDERRE